MQHLPEHGAAVQPPHDRDAFLPGPLPSNHLLPLRELGQWRHLWTDEDQHKSVLAQHCRARPTQRHHTYSIMRVKVALQGEARAEASYV